MTKKLIFATHNQHKKNEVSELLYPKFEILSLADINCNEDIPETGQTFAENATLKSTYVWENFRLDCFADDSGLEVEALDNEPGVFSARYAGQRGDQLNMNFLLKKMEGISNRRARFRTVVSLMMDGKNHVFEGTVNGSLRTRPVGSNGFGYDPIFEPEGYTVTFAEMELVEKNKISHRALAMQQLIRFLKQVSS